jgi:hypothetical protein
MKAEGRRSKGAAHRVVREWGNLKIVLLALFGLDGGAGGGVVHRPVLHAVLPDADAEGGSQTANLLIAASLLLGDAVLSRVRLAVGPDRAEADHHGGLLLAALTYFPLFRAITHYANPRSRRRRSARR